jgi:hypothetical protein
MVISLINSKHNTNQIIDNDDKLAKWRYYSSELKYNSASGDYGGNGSGGSDGFCGGIARFLTEPGGALMGVILLVIIPILVFLSVRLFNITHYALRTNDN